MHCTYCCRFLFQAEDGIRDLVRSRGLGDVYKRQHQNWRQCALRALGRRDFQSLTDDFYEDDDPLLVLSLIHI